MGNASASRPEGVMGWADSNPSKAHVPTMAQTRDAFANLLRDRPDAREANLAIFDRAVAAHDAEVVAKALADFAESLPMGHCGDTIHYLMRQRGLIAAPTSPEGEQE